MGDQFDLGYAFFFFFFWGQEKEHISKDIVNTSPGWEDPLEKATVTLSSILAWRILYNPWGHKELDTTE